MSQDPRFQVEPPPPPGMSTGTKIVLGFGLGCGLLFLLCCGGLVATVWLGAEMIAHAVVRDPEQIRTMTKELATVEIPADLHPEAAIDAKIPILKQPIFKAVIYTDGHDGKSHDQIFALGEFSKSIGAIDQQRLRDEIRKALSQEEQPGNSRHDEDHFKVEHAESVDLQIREQPANFRVEEGTGEEDRRLIRAMGQFEGTHGTALLFMQVDAEKTPKDRVLELIQSIR